MTVKAFIKQLTLETIKASHFQVRRRGERIALYTVNGKGHEHELQNGTFNSLGDNELNMEYKDYVYDEDMHMYIFFV